MSCCSDVMKPVEASSCCTPQDTAADAARAMRDSGCGADQSLADVRTQLHQHGATSLPMVDEGRSGTT